MRNASGHDYWNIVRSLWTWLLGRYHVPQNAFLVIDVTQAAVDCGEVGDDDSTRSDTVCAVLCVAYFTVARTARSVVRISLTHNHRHHHHHLI